MDLDTFLALVPIQMNFIWLKVVTFQVRLSPNGMVYLTGLFQLHLTWLMIPHYLNVSEVGGEEVWGGGGVGRPVNQT